MPSGHFLKRFLFSDSTASLNLYHSTLKGTGTCHARSATIFDSEPLSIRASKRAINRNLDDLVMEVTFTVIIPGQIAFIV